jgi:adenosylhomocysteine nucleosidase
VSDTNNGVISNGPGPVVSTGSAFGVGPVVSAPPPLGGRSGAADVGVLTVLGVELRAVARALAGSSDYRVRAATGGPRFHQATLGTTRVVALQSLHLGQRSTVVAFEQLREHWAPPVVALVGVAGAVHRCVDLGDVVVSDEVVNYDLSKETPDGVRRRGQSLHAPGMIGRRLNAFFAEHGEPLRLTDPAGEFSVRRGPIGSGEAIIADSAADIRADLAGFNDKLLAVETEAGGIAQAVHERLDQRDAPAGWLTIRGISDRAYAHDHTHHDIASRHAAAVLVHLLPYLTVGLPPA